MVLVPIIATFSEQSRHVSSQHIQFNSEFDTRLTVSHPLRHSSKHVLSWRLSRSVLCLQESPLPLTDPRYAEAQRILNNYSVSHHTVIKPFLLLGLSAEYRSRRWVWSTVVRQPPEVYDTHRRTKLTAPECNKVHLNYVKCIIVYTHITLELYRLD